MITVGFSTRKIDDNFVSMLKKTSGVSKLEIIPIENNGVYSLSEAYNKILNDSTNDIVVLMHDDIYFDSKNWASKVLNYFKRNSDYGILGVAGSTSLPSSGEWWEDFSKLKELLIMNMKEKNGSQNIHQAKVISWMTCCWWMGYL